MTLGQLHREVVLHVVPCSSKAERAWFLWWYRNELTKARANICNPRTIQPGAARSAKEQAGRVLKEGK